MTILTAGRVTAKQIINKHSAIFCCFSLRIAVSVPPAARAGSSEEPQSGENQPPLLLLGSLILSLIEVRSGPTGLICVFSRGAG